MSSSEQAPEPTMDEILASIRKIISDDETEGDAQPEVAAAEPAAAETAAPAGDGLADELANALSDAQGADSQAAVEPHDDILDLTQVVTEQPAADLSPEPAPPEPVSQEPASLEPAPQEAAPLEPAPLEPAPQEAAMPVVEDVQLDAAPAEPEADMTAAAPVAPNVLAEIEAPTALEGSEAPESSEGASDIAALLAEAGVQEMNDEAAPQEAPAPAGDDLNAAIAQDDMVVPDPVLVEETSISDALSALDQPAADAAPDSPDISAQDASFDADLVMSPEPAPAIDVPSEAIAPEVSEVEPVAEVVAEIEADAGLDVQMPKLSAEETPAEIQIEDVLPEPEELIIDEPAEAVAVLADALEEPAPVEDVLADLEIAVEPEAEIEAAGDIIEAAASIDADVEAPTTEEPEAEASSGDVRTLEDSVKELLRPMLREWIDDNMERIVQDEVASANLKDSDS